MSDAIPAQVLVVPDEEYQSVVGEQPPSETGGSLAVGLDPDTAQYLSGLVVEAVTDPQTMRIANAFHFNLGLRHSVVDVADLVSQAAVNVLTRCRNPRRYGTFIEFRPLFYTAVLNAGRDAVRASMTRPKTTPIVEDLADQPQVMTDRHRPTGDEVWSEHALMQRDIINAVRQLPARQRQLVTMHYLMDMSQPEIARLLGIDLGSIKSNMSRARHSLKPLLADWSDY